MLDQNESGEWWRETKQQSETWSKAWSETGTEASMIEAQSPKEGLIKK